jgi:hypothetical protein
MAITAPTSDIEDIEDTNGMTPKGITLGQQTSTKLEDGGQFQNGIDGPQRHLVPGS